MFSAADQAGGLALRLCFFRGFREFRAGPWHRDAVPLQRAMASVRCAAGHTQIERLLRFALEETRRERIAGLILWATLRGPIDRVAGVAGGSDCSAPRFSPFRKARTALLEKSLRRSRERPAASMRASTIQPRIACRPCSMQLQSSQPVVAMRSHALAEQIRWRARCWRTFLDDSRGPDCGAVIFFGALIRLAWLRARATPGRSSWPPPSISPWP